jgi:hypothetical protein
MALVFSADIVAQSDTNNNLSERALDENEQGFSRATIYGRTFITQLERNEMVLFQLKQRLSVLREELNELLEMDACSESGEAALPRG